METRERERGGGEESPRGPPFEGEDEMDVRGEREE